MSEIEKRLLFHNMKAAVSKVALTILTCAAMAISLCGCTTSATTTNTAADTTNADVLVSWTDDSNTKKVLTEFVENAVDETSDGYIPEEDRIAVFDLDGTLISETNPYYFGFMLFFYRVLEDETYDAPEEIKTFAQDVCMPAMYAGELTSEINAQFSAYQNEVYAGMTLDDFKDLVNRWMKTEVHGQDGITYEESFFVPMKEVVEYLQDNDFMVYIVSAGNRLTSRYAVEDTLNIPVNQVIGSDVNLVATNQGDTEATSYVFQTDDEILRGSDTISKSDKFAKVQSIALEIGKQPVLAFGNSGGDESMLLYTITNNQYPAEAFILMCDDTERDWGNEEKAETIKEMAEKDGFNAVSMKDEFVTIYGDNAKKAASKEE